MPHSLYYLGKTWRKMGVFIGESTNHLWANAFDIPCPETALHPQSNHSWKRSRFKHKAQSHLSAPIFSVIIKIHLLVKKFQKLCT